MASADAMTVEEAVTLLKKELNISEEKARKFVELFQHNKDGKVTSSDVHQFKQQIKEISSVIRRKFKEYDVDGSGTVSVKEASTVLRYPPFSFPETKILFLLSKYDKDQNGRLDIDEFAQFYAAAKTMKDDVSKLFAALDTDQNGVLSPDELIGILEERLGLDQATALNMINKFDTNKDGSLDISEFVGMWSTMFG